MRLIDADALKKDIARLHILNDEAEIRRAYASNPYSTLSDFEDILVSVFDAIDDAPTIEANRPKGKWHHIQSVCYGGGTMNEVVCSKCHEHYILPTNFCPYCGSDNRER